MTLLADAKLTNVEGSLRQYVHTTLGSTFESGDGIDYGGGEPFDETPGGVQRMQWLQVRLLDPVRPIEGYGRRYSATGPQHQRVAHLVNLNIFQRPAKVATPNGLSMSRLRDTVLGAFELRQKIPVLDYEGASAALGSLIVASIDRDAEVPSPAGTVDAPLQRNILVYLRWGETFNVS